MPTPKVANPYADGHGPKPLPVLPRLEARSRKDGECTVWTGPVDKDGYGKITVRNRQARVHRAAYEERHGRLNASQLVLHTCDNPPCFTDAHLYVGTQQDNMTDRFMRGRWKGGRPVKVQS
jgi:hypothetical protein